MQADHAPGSRDPHSLVLPAVKLEPSDNTENMVCGRGSLNNDDDTRVGHADAVTNVQPTHQGVEETEVMDGMLGQCEKETPGHPGLAEVKVEIDVAVDPRLEHSNDTQGEKLNWASAVKCSGGLPLPSQGNSLRRTAEAASQGAAKPTSSGWNLRVRLKEEPMDPGYDHHPQMHKESTKANCVSDGSDSLSSEAVRRKSHLHRGVCSRGTTVQQIGQSDVSAPAPDEDLESLPIHFQLNSQSQGSSDSVSSFKCEMCNATFTQLSSLKSHMRIYCGEKPYKCELCAAEFTRFAMLKQHTDSHVAEKQSSSNLGPGACSPDAQSSMASYCGEKPYKCRSCPAVFTWSFQLKTHMGTHRGEKAFKCSSCPASFKTNSNLKDHLRIHSGEKPYKCEHCPSAFARSTHLKRHSRTHSGEKPYKCGLCPSGFRQSIDLTRHMTIHTGEKPYKCEQCSSAFVRSWELKVHFRTHTGEKPYKCEHCPAAFTVLSALKTHTRLHSGDKPYACEFCPAAYTQSANLKSHMKKHSGQAVYRCGLCTSVFLESRNLQNHVMLLHNIEKIHSRPNSEKTDEMQGLDSPDSDIKE